MSFIAFLQYFKTPQPKKLPNKNKIKKFTLTNIFPCKMPSYAEMNMYLNFLEGVKPKGCGLEGQLPFPRMC